MWHFLLGSKTGNDDIVWNSAAGPGTDLGLNESGGVMVRLLFAPAPGSKFAAVQEAERLIGNTTRPAPLTWIVPSQDRWTIDLDGMRESQHSLSKLDWLKGTIVLAPEYERRRFDLVTVNPSRRFDAAFTIYITREVIDDQVAADEPSRPTREVHSTMKKQAFVMMSISSSIPELEDVLNTIKRACATFDIPAIRVDEVEHSGRITDTILDHIRNSSLLICDITYERPNVYYELGYAHGQERQVILTAKAGTVLHFDIKDYNVIFYENLTKLDERLRARIKELV